jgi:type II secretory pathway pseudopilin PulG
LLFFVAVLAIVAVSMAPLITFQIKRQREEEMIHRGVQYSRAVKRYYKKFGRYPTKIEDLESANNLRFLRKRYKDPVTGEDFKLLHYGDVKMSFNGGIAGAIPAGAAGQGPGAFGAQGGFGAPGGFGAQGPGGPNRSGGAFSGFGPAGGPGGQNSFGQNSFGQAGGNGPASPDPSTQNANGPAVGAGSNPTGTTTDSSGTVNTSGSNSSSSGGSGGGSDSQNGNNPNGANGSNNANGPGGQVFGGGPIVGVASASEKETIREFNKKHHYNEWQFIYDPNTDRGGLLSTPNQPPLQNANGVPGQNGTNGMPGMPGQPGQGGFGQSPFGQPGQFSQPTPQPPPQQPPPQGSNN